MRIVSRSLFFFTALLIAACSRNDAPELVVYNAQLITMDDSFDGASAFTVKSGVIDYVGNSDEARALATSTTELVDMEGQVVMPGFNDAHLHALILPEGSVEIGDVKELDELKSILLKQTAQTAPGEWVVVHGYDDSNFGGHLSRQDLDTMGIDKPILLLHASMHLYLVNTLALDNAGLGPDTKDPEGGFYKRDERGELTGLISERGALMPLFVESQPNPFPNEFQNSLTALSSFMQQALENGITSYSDAMVPSKLAYLYWWVDPKKQGVRVNLMFDGAELDAAKQISNLDEIARNIGWRPFSNPWLRGKTVKVFHGMSLSGRTARLHQEYSNRPGYFGEEPQRSQQQLNELVQQIQDAGFQTAVHANGDYEIDMVLDAYEKAINANQATDANNDPSPRHRIEHGSVVNAQIMKRMNKLGVVYAPHSYIYEKGPMMEAYGEKRWPWMFANASAFEYDVVNAGNSDYPVSALSPLLRIQSLVTRKSRAGKVYGEQQRLTVEQALKAYTYGGAYASFEEKVKGSISPGKYADFIVLSDDPRQVDVDQIHAIKVLATYSGGTLRFLLNESDTD